MTNTANTHLPTIVYVEDNDGDALLLEEALRALGFATQLLVIADGSKALRYFEIKESAQDVPPPHCILLDGYLPAVTGAQLFRFIRGSKVFDDTPVYLFAPEVHYKDLLADQNVAKESFITKPHTWDGFLELAKLLMRSAQAKQEGAPATPGSTTPEVQAEGELQRPEQKPRGG